jgi:nitrite reductase/ring-hydroxylating ferredoxin subunit
MHDQFAWDATASYIEQYARKMEGEIAAVYRHADQISVPDMDAAMKDHFEQMLALSPYFNHLNAVQQFEEVESDEAIIVTAGNGDRYEIAKHCPHAGVSLENAPIEGKRITCLNHHYVFDLDSGECESGNCTLRTRKLD